VASPTDGDGTDPFALRSAPPRHRALVTPDGDITYGELDQMVTDVATVIDDTHTSVVLVRFAPTVSAVVAYLATIRAGRVALLADAALTDSGEADLVARYSIGLVSDVETRIRKPSSGAVPVPTLQLPAQVLLPTSGSTGSPKMVRIPPSALAANASSIAADLGIRSTDIAPTTLPLQYSYGLSVLNSHLYAGATVMLTSHSVVTREFWRDFDQAACTSFAGVPYTYSMLRRLRFSPSDHPSLHTMTQAGGRLSNELRHHFHGLMSAAGGRFIVMYGQTEATARLAVLAHDDLPGRHEAAGRAIRGGRFAIAGPTGETSDADVEGEVIYYGPNVMHGYAENTTDLAAPDQLYGRLETGDRGRLDPEGYLWLTGRDKRIAKVFGTRMSLDDIEAQVAARGHVGAAVSGDDCVIIFVEAPADSDAIRRELASALNVHRTGIVVEMLEALPLLPTGKIDYQRLSEQVRAKSGPSGQG
jgi:acyl-CoA synthetase (AMP-forming)/AMP-acid ligase II